ncbi:MAG: SUMF1/EgtB/PvdO family nonheme iron enzyme, partial [Spirochaetes bacterium]|nr:SUMF1/EgtB/PvdO family nonheme iron enzyme [Spirochaetota bacterium]
MKNKTRYYSVMIMILTALSLLISSCGGDTPLKPSREDIPKWEQAYPKFSNLYETGLDLRVQINEDGMIYYVILPDNAIAPTATEVRLGGINGSIIEGSTNVKGNTEGVIKISGLAKSGKYDIYVVAEDFVLTPNLQEYPAKIDIDTTDDITSPEWLYGFPKAVNIDATAFDLKVCINEPGRVYYMVVLNNAEPPVSEAVKAGKYAVASGSVVVTTDTESIINITGLINNTDYDLYVVSEDNAGRPNIQSSPFKINVKTSNDISPPEWISTYPQTDSIGPTSLDIKVKINESGLVYYSVLPNNSPAPSSGDVKTGKDAVKSGVVLASADTEKTMKISGLTGGTEYDVYITAEDYKINLQTIPVKFDVTTSDINDSDSMVFIQGGTFSMGHSTYQHTAYPHMVTFTYDFYIGKYEVT